MQEAKNNLNLKVLKKYEESITEILYTCSHVVLYEFNSTINEWKKKQIEGSLFLYKRSNGFGFIILNRIGLENLKVIVTSEFQIQRHSEYLMYRLESSIYGLWIFLEEDRLNLLYQLDECILSLNINSNSTVNGTLGGTLNGTHHGTLHGTSGTSGTLGGTHHGTLHGTLHDTSGTHHGTLHGAHNMQSMGQSSVPLPLQTQRVTLDEIWISLENMAPHSQPVLSEPEFMARFQILVQSPFFARSMYHGYLSDRS